MASLKQIAADVGVSHALVSRVLNNRMGTTGVSEKTREAILRRARELNYRPNPLALALREGRRGAVGVYVHDVGVSGTNFINDLLQGAGNALEKLGVNLVLHYFTGQVDFEAACDSKLLTKVDGIIIGGIGFSWMRDRLKELEQQGLTIVLACHGESLNDFTNFQVSNEEQGYIAAKHLLDIGCRRIIHLNTIEPRFNGYCRALEEAGVPLDRRLVFQMPRADHSAFAAKAGFEAAKRIMESGIAFDAIQAQSDAQAAGVLQCYAYAGIAPSKWPKITGIDDSPIARDYALRPLTSVTAEMAECGRLAADALFKKLHGEKVQSQNVSPKLVVRDSTVPDASA